MDEQLVQLVWRRADGRCEYCFLPQTGTTLSHEFDHVIAAKHGGRTTAGNLALACFTFNHHKGPNIAGIDPVTNSIVRLYNPRRHKWDRHFTWAGPILVGRTAIGRATIAILEINLSYRVEIRAALMDEGVCFA